MDQSHPSSSSLLSVHCKPPFPFQKTTTDQKIHDKQQFRLAPKLPSSLLIDFVPHLQPSSQRFYAIYHLLIYEPQIL
jgi:hypothetical protein